MLLIIAEKPSVARDIARVVGATRNLNGYLEGNGYQVSWAIGHLVTLSPPHEVNPDWKTWRKESLPMLPSQWPLKVIEKTKSQFSILKSLMNKADGLICATDAGREGELIFRFIYEAANCSKPVKRLWISSLTSEAIQTGLKNMKGGHHFDGLASAARARSCADWLIGLNLSRAYALTHQEQYFVGRVQTPTLAIIVKRDLEIRHFVPEKYLEIVGHFCSTQEGSQSYRGTYFYFNENKLEQRKLAIEGTTANLIVNRTKQGEARIHSVESKRIPHSPPLLYDLTELQRHANRLFGYSAAKTLEVAQALYEKHKVLSYPRTDSKYLSQAIVSTLPSIVESIRKPYENLILKETGVVPISSRYINDQKVTDHHAIIPTGVSSRNLLFSEEEQKIYDLVCRRLLSCWQKDYVTAVTTLITRVDSTSEGSPFRDLFKSYGTMIEELGWKRLDLNKDEGEKDLPSGLKPEQKVTTLEIRKVEKSTQAPPHLTEAALLAAMESAGKTLEDKELASHIRESGLGTPATRAGMIETLLSRGYIARKEKFLLATSLGIQLIETVHSNVKSPELTARWEKALSEIESGNQTFDEFIETLQNSLKTQIHEIFTTKVKAKPVDPHHPIVLHILRHLDTDGASAVGKLYEKVSHDLKTIHRREFESVILSLEAVGKIKVTHQKFEKDGKKIAFRRISL